MAICSDPLQTVRCVGPREQWCVPLPAQYPTILPYAPANVECYGPEPVESALVQRIQQKIDLYQTPSSNDARQMLQCLTTIIQKHVPDFTFKDVTTDQPTNKVADPHISPTASVSASPSNSPSFLQRLLNRKTGDKELLSEQSSHHSHMANDSVQSTNLPSTNAQSKKGSRQFTPNSNDPDTLGSQIHSSPSSSNPIERDSIVTSISVPVTPYLSKQTSAESPIRQAVQNISKPESRYDNLPSAVSTANVNDHHLDSSCAITPSPISPSLRPQQTTDGSLSTSVVSPDDFRQQQVFSLRSPSNQFTQELSAKNDEKQNGHQPTSWTRKFVERLLPKRFTLPRFQTSSPEESSPMIRSEQLHMNEALAALELRLTREAFQELINKRKDSQQHKLMYLLMAPARCCRSCRTQRRLASAAQHSVNIAIRNLPVPS